jgi:hypothetical protein
MATEWRAWAIVTEWTATGDGDGNGDVGLWLRATACSAAGGRLRMRVECRCGLGEENGLKGLWYWLEPATGTKGHL